MEESTHPSLLPLTSLADLSSLLQAKEHLFALDAGDVQLADSAMQVAKGLFDLGLSLEQTSHPHLHPLLSSLASQDALATTRASSMRKAKASARESSPPPIDPLTILPFTPSAGLFVDGMSHDQVWKQLEMRSGGLGGVFKVLGEDEVNDKDEERELELEDSSSNEEEVDEEEGEFNDDEQEMLQQMIDEGMSIEDIEKAMGEYREAMGRIANDDSDLDDDDEDEDEEEDDEDDDDEDEDEDMEEGEDEDELMDGDEDIEMSDGSGEEEEDDVDLSLDPLFAGRGKSAHPTLDDDFFSIDAFNRITEEAEASKMSSGRLGDDDEDEEDEEEDLAGLMTGGGGALEGDEDVMYGDFFAPPPRDRTQPRKPKPTKSAKSKGKGKEKASVSFAEIVEEDTSRDPGNSAEYGRKTMSRVRGDLFADDDDEEDPEAQLSNHEKRQLALQEQIRALEQENVGPKDWTLLGEAAAKARPENSLLEEDLEYEHTGKVVPVITEERVASLEEIIKRRILDNNFDDIVRRRELDDKAFLPSRFFELQDQQSSRSLAQIYEDEFTAAQTTASGGKVVDPRDAKLQKEHQEIDKLWGEISYTLDALSNLNYTPKQPKTAITTISNVASTTLESALPTTQSTSTMLAPEEVFAPPTSSSLVARTELDPEEKRKARAKARKQKMQMRQGLDAAVDKYAGKGGGGGKARGGVRAEKDRALAELVKTGKGVTVIGKDSTKKRGGKAADASTVQASKLKL